MNIKDVTPKAQRHFLIEIDEHELHELWRSLCDAPRFVPNAPGSYPPYTGSPHASKWAKRFEEALRS